MILNNDELQFAIDSGIINVEDIKAKAEMKKREEILQLHKYKKSLGKDGKWRTHINSNGKITSLCKNSEKELDDAIVKHLKSTILKPTVEDVYNDWMDTRYERKKISDATYHRYSQDFERYFKEIRHLRIEDMSSYDFEDFLEEAVGKYNLTSKAFSNLKTIVRGCLKRAKKQGLIKFDVEVMLQDLDISDKEFKRTKKADEDEVFNDDEMETIVNYFIENQTLHHLGLLLVFLTGMRIGELVALKSENLDLVNGIVNVTKTETRYKKDGKYICEVIDKTKTIAGTRQIPVPKDYKWVLNKLRASHPFGDYIFTNRSGERMTAHAMRMRFKRVCKHLGIKYRSVHKIRKTYGSILLDNNMNSKMVIGLMGHTDVYCTEKYYHKNRSNLKDVQTFINNVPEFCRK